MRSLVFLCSGLLAAIAHQASAATIIDNFNDPLGTTLSAVGNPVTVTTADSGVNPEILGLYRDVTFNFNPATESGQGSIQYNGSLETTSYTTSGTSADLTIAYDGAGVPGAGLGGANLSGDGSTGFILAADWNPNAAGAGTPLFLGITVNGVTKSVLIPDNVTATAYFIPFAYWGLSVDFSAVNSILLNFHLQSTDNASFADFYTDTQGDVEQAPLVPEPTTLALACMGLVGFGGYARRRMKAGA